MTQAKLDENSRPTLTALSSAADGTIVTLYADPVTHRLLTSAAAVAGLTGFEAPTGAINGVNRTFTVTHVPAAIVLRNMMYFENEGYTRSSLTLTINSDLTPQTGDSFKSLY